MPKPFPEEFLRRRRACGRKPGRRYQELAQIAKDFGVHVGTLDKWMRQARVDDGEQPGVTASESVELRELRKREPSP